MYKPQELATKLGLSVRRLQRWDKTGKLPAKRTVTNYRYYTEDDLRIAQGLKPLEAVRKTVIYCRVSSNAQKPELKNQVAAMQTFCLGRGMVIDETITEIGGGLNFKRKKFMALIISALKGEVKTIVIAHKDRLCRFAFDFIEQLAELNGCNILVANQESLSPQQELVEDLMAIIHCFSCRLYGLRNYSQEIKETIDKYTQSKLEYKGEDVQC